MAKYKVLKPFKGLEEKKKFKIGEEIELTVKRADEIAKNIKENFGVIDVLERIEEKTEGIIDIKEGNEGEKADK